VGAYSTLANGGYKITPYLVDRIEASDGEVVFQANPMTACNDCEDTPKPDEVIIEEAEEVNSIDDILSEEVEEISSIDELLNPEINETIELKPPIAERIMDERVAYIMDSFLKDVVKKGTGRRALVLRRSDLAGKTGTTNGPTDAWFSGYGGGIVTTTWLGFDNNALIGRNEFGGSAALPIWIDYMRIALKGIPDTPRRQPEGIVTVKIDPDSGKLATPGQTNAIFEIFRAELVPQEMTDPEDVSSKLLEEDTVQEADIF
jgi:penicillin-binding protein 1A